jgi:hypothetical protein
MLECTAAWYYSESETLQLGVLKVFCTQSQQMLMDIKLSLPVTDDEKEHNNKIVDTFLEYKKKPGTMNISEHYINGVFQDKELRLSKTYIDPVSQRVTYYTDRENLDNNTCKRYGL